jgi:TolB-like protein
MKGGIFTFEGYTLDLTRGCLRAGEDEITLRPKCFDLLQYLVENPGRLLLKDELAGAVWPNVIVGDNSLAQCIGDLRNALNDVDRRIIKTVTRRGYVFAAPVSISAPDIVTRLPAFTSPVPSVGIPPPTEVVDQLKPGLALPEKPSIVVLPFSNMSDDPEQEYFADGMVEEITTALSKVRWFFVVARNSSFTYKGRAVDLRQVGRELGVRYVLEGSVRKAGDRVRISGQLIEAATGGHLWAERYDRRIADIFAVQDEMAERIIAAIEPELYAAEHFRSQRKPPESLDAWECVIRALSYMGQCTRTADAQAEVLCRRAIAISPDYGQAHSLLAWVLIRRASLAGELINAILPEARAEARRALGLDQGDAWAHLTSGQVLWRNRRHCEAERAFRRSLELNPNFALAHALLGGALAAKGAYENAMATAEYALRLSPRDWLVDFYASRAIKYAHFGAGNYFESLAWARRLTERYPEYIPGFTWLAATAGLQGDMETAAEALTVLLRQRSHFSLAWMRQNLPFSEEILERLLTGLQRAGLPEDGPRVSSSPKCRSLPC